MDYRIIISIFAFFSLISTGMILHTNRLQENIVKSSALDNARLYSNAIETFRTLYASEVVSVARKQGLEVTHDYHDKMAIPLPATLSMLLGNKIGESDSGASTKLYSPYPFPWRKETGGLVDGFAEKAWTNISADSSKPYFEFFLDSEQKTLRYAAADEMRASCIECHNNHPDSPKTDWKEGDLRGILEVNIPLNNVINRANNDLNISVMVYTLLSILGMIGILFMLKKHKDETNSLRMINDELNLAFDEIEILRGIIPICSWCHNIRDDEGSWEQMESYISQHTEASFSHGICPDCLAEVRP